MMKWNEEITYEMLPLKDWLTTKNITNKLKELGSVTLSLISQQLTECTREEELLTAEKECLIRQVYISVNDTPYTFGRVVIPKRLYIEIKDNIDNLGNNFIGNSLLYKSNKIKRSSFTYRIIDKNDMLAKDFPQKDKTNFFARQSIFTINQKPLLLTDVFLEENDNYYRRVQKTHNT